MNSFIDSLKNKKVFIAGIVIFIIAAAAIIFSICANTENDKGTVNIYFLNSVTNEICSEKRIIENGEELLENGQNREFVNAVLNEMIKGPKNTGLTSTFPENIEILECSFINDDKNGNTVEINFSNAYNSLTDSQELICRGAIVKTLTELNFVKSINIFVDGKPILRNNGETVGDLNNSDIKLNPSISPYRTDNLTVTLYFADENAMVLCPENRIIEINEKQNVENKIVEELINGPENEALYSVIPPETKINNINTEGGICFVDLSGDFISKHNGGSAGEIMTIYSIVNSLTELDYVKQVQFLIDGVKVNSLTGHVDFSKTFERNESLIIEEKNQ